MGGRKYYPYRGELDDDIRHAMFENNFEDEPLYVDTWGNLYAQVETPEGSYHPDDKSVARVYYQSLGIRI